MTTPSNPSPSPSPLSLPLRLKKKASFILDSSESKRNGVSDSKEGPPTLRKVDPLMTSESEDDGDQKKTARTPRERLTTGWKKVKKNIQRKSTWLHSLSHLSPQEIRKKFAIETGRYVLFLILFTVITLVGRDSKYTFLLTREIREQYTANDFPHASLPKTFMDVGEVDEFWQWLTTSLYENTFPSAWYNGQPFTDDNRHDAGYVMLTNKIVGAVRVRQVRVEKQKCHLPRRLKGYVSHCYPPYSKSKEQTDPWLPQHAPSNQTAYEWSSEHDLSGLYYWGEVGLYSGGGRSAIVFIIPVLMIAMQGYVIDLPSNETAYAQSTLSRLHTEGWIDDQTRAVLVEFTLYNGNLDLHSQVKLVGEFPASGGVVPSFSIRTQRIIRYTSTTDYIVLVLELIFICFLLYYIYEEFKEMKADRWVYLTDGWNYVDWANIICFIVVISLRIKQLVDITHLNLTPEPDEYVNFERLTFAISQEQNINAFNGLLMWFKFFKYIHIFPKMKMLTRTLEKSARSVLYFMIMYFIIFLGFVFAMYISMGSDIEDFSNIQNAMYTLFRATLGDFDFREMRAGNRVLGPFLFVTYTLLVFLVLANMFIAIISQTYEREMIKKKHRHNQLAAVEHAIFGFITEKMERAKNALVRLYEGWVKNVKDADKDGDGMLSQAELEELKKEKMQDPEFRKILEAADKDHDNQLSAAETKDLLQNLKKMKKKAGKIDDNGHDYDCEDPTREPPMLISSVTAEELQSMAAKSHLTTTNNANSENNNNRPKTALISVEVAVDSQSRPVTAAEEQQRNFNRKKEMMRERAAEEYESLIMDFVRKYIEREFVESTEDEKTPLYYYFRDKFDLVQTGLSAVQNEVHESRDAIQQLNAKLDQLLTRVKH